MNAVLMHKEIPVVDFLLFLRWHIGCAFLMLTFTLG